MTTTYDERVEAMLKKEMKDREYNINYPTAPRINPMKSVVEPPKFNLPDVLPFPITAQKPAEKPAGSIWTDPTRWLPEMYNYQKEVVETMFQPSLKLDKELNKIPHVGHLLSGLYEQLPGMVFFGTIGIDYADLAAMLNVMKTNFSEDIQLRSDVKNYGVVDGFLYNLMKRAPEYIGLHDDTLEDFFPASVKANLTKGIGDDRLEDFFSVKKEHQYNPNGHEQWLSTMVSDISYKASLQRPDMIADYTYDQEQSDKNIAVYKNTVGDLLIGIRGTDPFDMRDLSADLAIIGKSEGDNEYFQTTVKRVEKIINQHNIQYGTEGKTIVSGHSLGGHSINAVMAEPHIAESVYMTTTFAPGATPTDLDFFPGENEPQENIDKRGHDVKHMHQYVTSKSDFLSRSIGHNIPGTVHRLPTDFGHSITDEMLSEEWWNNRQPDEFDHLPIEHLEGEDVEQVTDVASPDK